MPTMTKAARAQYFRFRRQAANHHKKAVEYRSIGQLEQADIYRDLRDRCAAASIRIMKGKRLKTTSGDSREILQDCRDCGNLYDRRLFHDDPCPACGWRPYRD